MKKQPKRIDRPGVDRYGRTAMHEAALADDAGRIRELVAQGLDPGTPDDNGWTPLHIAAQAWSVSACEALLGAGAPVDAREAVGNTPLWRAVFESRGRGEVIRLLRDHGADVTITNNHGVSPVKLAHTIGNFDVRQFFADVPESDWK
jgi:ankyrin repeat protein